MENTTLPPAADRMKVAAFGLTTVLTSPLYKLPQEAVTKVATLFVQRMKEANVRHEGIKQIILDFAKA